jgi:hypothetical protein
MRLPLGAVGRVFRVVLGNPGLRRVQIAFMAFCLAEYGTWIAILVFAYHAGGPAEAGIIGGIQLLPSALFAPLLSSLGDRYPPGRVLAWGYVAQTVSTGLTGLALVAGAPTPLTYGLATIAATAITITRPVQGAVFPALSRTPAQLTGANVMAGWSETASIFAGPFVAGLLLAVSSPGVVFLSMAAGLLIATALTAGIAGDVPAPGLTEDGVDSGGLLGGIRALAEEPDALSVSAVMAGNFFLMGALDILFVILALRLLHLGNAGAGFLNSAFGVGGLVGIIVLAFLSRRHVATNLVVGAGCWCAGLVFAGFAPGAAPAFVLIGLAGAGRSLVDASGRTLLQRAVPETVLVRVFGVIEGLSMGLQGLAMFLVPAGFALLGTPGIFIAAGLLIPLVIAFGWRRLWVITMPNIPEEIITLLRSNSIFEILPLFSLERVAGRLVPLVFAPGEDLITQGEEATRFYILSGGTAEVLVDGQFIRALGPGDVCGEIGLLRRIPRTATVRATTEMRVYALSGADFLQIMTGHVQSGQAAETLVRERLAAGSAAAADSPSAGA